jgi:hypothetical protein
MPSSMGERTGRGVRLEVKGEASFEAFGAVAFLPLGLIWLFGFVPGWPMRSVSFELGTSRVVGKQGERSEATVSSEQTRLRTAVDRR